MKLRDEDFIEFFDQVKNDPELGKALLNPRIIDENIEKLQKVNDAISYPLLICDNPDTELSLVKTQLNFILPAAMRKSKEPYVLNLKSDINMYKKLYEKYSKQTNELINKTKDSIKRLYQPLKNLKDEIKNNSNNFTSTIRQTSVPLQNKKEYLNRIDYKQYPQDKQKSFKKEKEEINKEINNYLSETENFYKNYMKINENNLEEIEKFVEKFKELAIPAKELTIFMRKLFKAFEKSASEFINYKNKKKIDEVLQKIKEPINEFYTKSENIKKFFSSEDTIVNQNKIDEIKKEVDQNKEIMQTLMQKSSYINDKIHNIREKYGEKEEDLKSMSNVDAAPLNILEASQQMNKEKEEIKKDAEKGFNDLIIDASDVLSQSRLNLLFIMDITNSMDAYLKEAKEGILDMIKEIRKQCPGIEIFLGFIAYKDFSDLDLGEEYINLEFTTDYESIKKNIEFLEADGGGDTPEDLCGAFDLAKNKMWSAKSRFIILVTDSPCHGVKYHDLKGDQADNYPEGDREKRNIEDYIAFFAKNEISLYCLRINSTTDKMFDIFKKIYDENKKADSKNQFVVQQKDNLFSIVTENAVNTFQNRKNLEIKE